MDYLETTGDDVPENAPLNKDGGLLTPRDGCKEYTVRERSEYETRLFVERTRASADNIPVLSVSEGEARQHTLNNVRDLLLDGLKALFGERNKKRT